MAICVLQRETRVESMQIDTRQASFKPPKPSSSHISFELPFICDCKEEIISETGFRGGSHTIKATSEAMS